MTVTNRPSTTLHIEMIKASAGSGKTHRLTVEYIKRLFSLYKILKNTAGQIPVTETPLFRNIFISLLAITFTNKATEEMKRRIIHYLKAIALPENEKFAETRSLLNKDLDNILSNGKTISLLAKGFLDNLFVNYSDFNVKTIDSLMTSFIKVLSPELSLPPEASVEIEFDEELKLFTRDFIAKVTEEKWEYITEVLEDLISTEQNIPKQIESVIERNLITLFKKTLIEDIEIKSLSYDKLIQQRDSYYIETTKHVKEFLDFIDQYTDFINKSKIPDSTKNLLQNIAVTTSCDVNAIKQLIEKKFITNSIHDKDYSFYKNRENLNPQTEQKGKELLNAVTASLKELLSSLSLLQYSRFSALFRDFKEAWSKRNNRTIYVLELSSILKEVLNGLKGNYETNGHLIYESIPYLYYKLSDRFRHFLFDEFQDTSEIQFKALTPLLEEVFSSIEGSTLLTVGDPKQAIYRWRGGKSELMDEETLKKYFSPQINIKTDEPLSDNYRSLPNIVEFNNIFWHPDTIQFSVNGEETENIKKKIRLNFQGSTQHINRDNDPGYVNISAIYCPKTENQVDQYFPLYTYIKNTIDNHIQQGYKPKDIAILLRDNKQIQHVVGYLESNGISTVTDESLHLSSIPLINEIISFIRFIEYPLDNLSLFTFINGEIVKQATNLDIQEFTKKLLQRDSKIPLFKILQSDFPELWEDYIAYFYRSSGLIPPYDLVQDFISKFKVYENFPSLSSFVLKFLDILHQMEEQGINSLSAFLEKWDSNLKMGITYSIDPIETEEAISVMTIHKSKGLEFPVVIVPIIDKREQNDSIFIANNKLYHIPKSYTQVSTELKDIYDKEMGKKYIDNLNLLYVAFTRARESLNITIGIKQKQENIAKKPLLFNITLNTLIGGSEQFSNAKMLDDTYSIKDKLESMEDKSGATVTLIKKGKIPVKMEKESKAQEKTNPQYPSSKQKLTNQLNSDILIFKRHTPRISSPEAIRGEKLHRMLSQIGAYSSVKELKERLKELSLDYGLEEDETNRIIDFLTGESVAGFYTGNIRYKNEEDIISVKRGDNLFVETKRIDRLVIRDNKITVIDYKFGEKETSHQDQVKEYIRILEEIYPQPIEGYLFYIFHNSIETVSTIPNSTNNLQRET